MDILLSSYLHDEKARASTVEPSFRHRLALTRTWDIQPGSRVLDIGCGQGESSLVLALINGPHGRIAGIDTAPPDYGGPYTIEQSQKHIQESALGERIEFLRADTASLFLHYASTGPFDAAVLCHSLWYFPDPASIAHVFQLLANANVRYLCLAEYGFRASRPEQRPHVLAARAQAQFHSLRKSVATGTREPNVRSALTPTELLDAAGQSGWREKRSGYMQPDPQIRDGQWEVQFVSSRLFQQWIQEEDLANEESMSAAIREVEQSTQELRARGVTQWETMDVFWAVLELDLSHT
ncbi:S-adenosyl-L-methionine-dependent methyltransferase [Penicillium canariense]|uniref:S-adenosyl-L-methionine-dependent methyltransferase n=1 Tax=Penicillium canariense TaxID=189055 RepID=A0A9W9I6F8_9EURO|nr:S-adenosyl-L-methionine-dependent methyltransferase [Penicillium canariense]KAJ5167465.1 S-adenosyl-L-methionine-dependent methyltransferase [Penicillium canariense]